MRRLNTLLAIVLLVSLALGGCAQRRPSRLLLIVVDTLRADHLGFYGYDRPTTPELDRWVERGLVFDQALATSPWTLPTFGSILTGLAPIQHGAGARFQSENKWRRAPMDDRVETLAEVLQRQGWATGAIVSNPFLREHFGAARGFASYDYEKGRSADRVIDLAIDWISGHRRQPFLLMVHLIDPHLPYAAPKSVAGRFGDSSDSRIATRHRKAILEALPELTTADREIIRRRYDEEVAFVDQQLGRLLAHLDDEGLLAETLVVLTADHGEELFDRGGFEHGHSMYQELLRVPLVVWGPGVRVGREPLPVSLIDLAPTMLASTGQAVPEGMTGASLWPTLQKGSRPPERELLAENMLWGRDQLAIVLWPHKLIFDPQTRQARLYNLERDPDETVDLVAEEPETAAELGRRLQDRMAELRSDRAEAPVVLTEEMEEELRALGYLD